MLSAAVAFASPMAGCTPLSSWFASSKKTDSSSSVAPERPLVSNAFAYARYVAMNLEPSIGSREWNDESVRKVLVDHAVASGIQPDEVLAILSAEMGNPTATPSLIEGKIQGPEVDRGTSVGSEMGSTFQRISSLEAQHGRCMASGQRTARACCEALALPLAVLPEWKSMSQEQRSALSQVARTGDADARRRIYEAWGEGFRLQGLKAWLSVCHGTITKQPETLEEFRKSEWFQAVATVSWKRMLHPRSRAKQGPRRIQTRSDGQVSIAETLKPDTCAVTETEVIVRRPDGALNFWVYDAAGKTINRSHFPAPGRSEGSHDTIEKPSPDACMGCHYDLKARTFDVLFPSADELKLAKTSNLPLLCRLADEPVAEDN